MKFNEIPPDTPDDTFVFIECDITAKTKKTRYGAAKANVKRNNGKYITNWGLAKLNNPMKRDDVKAKVKKTNLEKYGNTMPMNSQENIEKRREQFKDEEFKKEWLEKHKKTSIEKYGVEHPMQSEIVQENQRAAMRKNYGVDYPYQSEEIMRKMKKNNFKNYGVENVAQLPEVQIKMAKTTLERYGVEHYNQLPEMRDYLREHCREWLGESWQNPWAKGIVRPEEWNQKQRETVTDLMDEGKWKSGSHNSIKGIYNSIKCKRKNPMFRSSYELKVHWHLDNNDNVLWYDYEPFKVAYIDANGKRRYYIIDFVVKYKDVIKPLAIEIKNDYNKERFLECGKQEAFTEECSSALDFTIWSTDQINELNLDLERLLGSELVKPFPKF